MKVYWLIIAGMLIGSSIAQGFCKTSVMESYMLRGEVKYNSEINPICTSITKNCCHKKDMLKIHDEYTSSLLPRLTSYYEKVQQSFKALSRLQSKTLTIEFEVLGEFNKQAFCKEKQDIYKGFAFDSMLDNLQMGFEKSFMIFKDVHSSFMCSLCDFDALNNINPTNRLVVVDSGFCLDLLNRNILFMNAMNVALIDYFQNLQDYLDCAAFEGYYAFPFLFENKQDLQKAVKECYANFSDDALSPPCEKVCSNLNIGAISPIFEGDFTFINDAVDYYSNLIDIIKETKAQQKSVNAQALLQKINNDQEKIKFIQLEGDSDYEKNKSEYARVFEAPISSANGSIMNAMFGSSTNNNEKSRTGSSNQTFDPQTGKPISINGPNSSTTNQLNGQSKPEGNRGQGVQGVQGQGSLRQGAQGQGVQNQGQGQGAPNQGQRVQSQDQNQGQGIASNKNGSYTSQTSENRNQDLNSSDQTGSDLNNRQSNGMTSQQNGATNNPTQQSNQSNKQNQSGKLGQSGQSAQNPKSSNNPPKNQRSNKSQRKAVLKRLQSKSKSSSQSHNKRSLKHHSKSNDSWNTKRESTRKLKKYPHHYIILDKAPKNSAQRHLVKTKKKAQKHKQQKRTRKSHNSRHIQKQKHAKKHSNRKNMRQAHKKSSLHHYKHKHYRLLAEISERNNYRTVSEPLFDFGRLLSSSATPSTTSGASGPQLSLEDIKKYKDIYESIAVISKTDGEEIVKPKASPMDLSLFEKKQTYGQGLNLNLFMGKNNFDINKDELQKILKGELMTEDVEFFINILINAINTEFRTSWNNDLNNAVSISIPKQLLGEDQKYFSSLKPEYEPIEAFDKMTLDANSVGDDVKKSETDKSARILVMTKSTAHNSRPVKNLGRSFKTFNKHRRSLQELAKFDFNAGLLPRSNVNF